MSAPLAWKEATGLFIFIETGEAQFLLHWQNETTPGVATVRPLEGTGYVVEIPPYKDWVRMAQSSN